MIVVLGVHRADQAQLVGHAAKVGNHLGHHDPGLPVAAERKRSVQQLVLFAAGLKHLDLDGVLPAVVLLESGLGVE